MRVEPHSVGSIVHVIKRGTRGMKIVRDTKDCERFVRALFYVNDTHTDPHGLREAIDTMPPDRPTSWPERDPLVSVLAWTLLSNHFHLLLQETREGGIAKYMQRLCGSMTVCFNTKYQEKGSLFQGGYRGVVVDAQAHLGYLAFYILVKNVLDMYPGGVTAASKDFGAAWEWARRYPYSSLRDYLEGADSPILDDADGIIGSIIGNSADYKEEAREFLDLHIATKGNDFALQMLEPW